MTYALTREDIDSITEVEHAFSTNRLLPTWEEIPVEFKSGNKFTMLVEALFYGSEIPSFEMEIDDSIDNELLKRCVYAHLASYAPKHEHKIAGVAYMISSVTISSSEPFEQAPMNREYL